MSEAKQRRRIAVVTSSRADYSHLYWPLREMQDHPALEPMVIATGAHLSPEFGRTVEALEQDGFPVIDRLECLLSSDTDVGMAKTIGVGTLSFADCLGHLRPDLVMVLADRYEMLAPANVALALRIPIVHTEGGERSEGAIDQVVRNALTMMSHVHLVTTPAAARGVIGMGEEEWRVHAVGAPSLDHLRRSPLPDRPELEARLGFAVAENAVLVGYHPVTLDVDPVEEAGRVYEFLSSRDEPLIFCFPNADAGSRDLIRRAEALCASRSNAHIVVNLEPPAYWSLLGRIGMVFGNSSSGVMETTSVGVPAIDVGRRQQGRERAANVIHAAADPVELEAAWIRAQGSEFRGGLTDLESPYGSGHAAERIARILAELPDRETLLDKRIPGELPERVERP